MTTEPTGAYVLPEWAALLVDGVAADQQGSDLVADSLHRLAADASGDEVSL